MKHDASRAIRGLLEGRPSVRAVSHLVRGCEPCCRELARTLGPTQHPDLHPVLERLARRLQTVHARLQIERKLAPNLVARLLRHPHGRRLTIARNSWQTQSPAVVELLMRRSRALLGRNLAEATRLAELGKEVADRLALANYGEALVLDLRGRARVALALAWRKRSRYREAQAELASAEELFLAGSRDGMDVGSLHEERGELFSRMKRIRDARECFRRAAKIYLQQGRSAAVGRVLHRLARGWAEVDEPGKEARILVRALELTQTGVEGRPVLALAHNLLESLLETGQTERALVLIRVTAPLYDLFGTPADRVVTHWTQARILAANRDHCRAVVLFRSARRGFLDLGMPVEAATCALEGALAHLELGELEHAKRIATQVLPVFDSHRLGHEAMAALALLRQVEKRATTSHPADRKR